jgi:hypothetical protein
LILHFDIKIKDLIKAGKDYLWPRPVACPCCDGKLWGHGYTARYFLECKKPLWLKRYRCVECHAVHTLRPKTHWRRFQFPLATIIESLRTKIVDNLWLKDHPRQRQQYWFQGFKAQLSVNNPCAVGSTLKHLKSLLTKNIIAATHSLRWFRLIIQGGLACVPMV